MRLNPYLFAAVASAAPLAAQEFIGFSYNGQVSFTTRGFVASNAAGEIMNRIDGNDYAGWGTDTPGTRTITSLFFIVQDQNFNTAEVFNIKIYPESVANPGFPDLAAGVTFATGVTGPGAPPSGVVSAAVKVVTPATPVSVPIQGGGDVFVSWVLPVSPTGTNVDGLSIQALNGNTLAAATATMDVPGPTKFPQGNTASCSSGVSLTGTSTLTYSVAREWVFDVAHNGTGGVAMTITNQASLAGSANPPPVNFGPAPGTASFLSGTAPDGNGFNAGRADDITFDFFKTGFGTGGLVAFLRDTDFSSTFGPELQVGAFFPGSTGVNCLVSFEIIGFGLTTADEAFLVTPIPAPIRPILSGLTAKHQAVGIDALGNFIASPCAAQHF